MGNRLKVDLDATVIAVILAFGAGGPFLVFLVLAAMAIIVLASFTNVANAGGCSYSKSKSAEATTEEVKLTAVKMAEVEA